MKKLLVASVLITALVAVTAQAQVMHQSSVRGNQFSPGENGAVNVALDASGDVAGRLQVTISRSAEGEVTGGTWFLTLTRANGEGEIESPGSISGTVMATAVSLDEITLNSCSLNLAIDASSGELAGAAGSGALTLAREGADDSLSGTLNLTY